MAATALSARTKCWAFIILYVFNSSFVSTSVLVRLRPDKNTFLLAVTNTQSDFLSEIPSALSAA